MTRRRRNKGQEDEDGERWILTYSDMITLLLVFFIVLYSMSKLNQNKFNALIQSLRDAFHVGFVKSPPSNTISINVPMDAKAPTQNSRRSESQNNDQHLSKLYPGIESYIKAHHLEDKMSVTDLSRGVQITIQGDVLFDLGKAKIKKQVKPVLHDIGGFLKNVNNPIVIKGYTDNLPIHTTQFPSNWELSMERANNVRIYLQNKANIKPQRMRIVGFGEYHPRVSNNSKAHRAENRRVNIVVLRKMNPAKETVNAGS